MDSHENNFGAKLKALRYVVGYDSDKESKASSCEVCKNVMSKTTSEDLLILKFSQLFLTTSSYSHH